MLLTTLLAQHPEAIVDIVRHTPAWVGGLLAGLTALGWMAARPSKAHVHRVLSMPLAMGALAVWGVVSAFGGAPGRLAQLLPVWLACYAAVTSIGFRLAAPAGARYNAATRELHLPGSWVPLMLILGVFAMKYVIGVQLAMEPTLAQSSSFAFIVIALYGVVSGLFAARTVRLLRLAFGRQPAAALA